MRNLVVDDGVSAVYDIPVSNFIGIFFETLIVIWCKSRMTSAYFITKISNLFGLIMYNLIS